MKNNVSWKGPSGGHLVQISSQRMANLHQVANFGKKGGDKDPLLFQLLFTMDPSWCPELHPGLLVSLADSGLHSCQKTQP